MNKKDYYKIFESLNRNQFKKPPPSDNFLENMSKQELIAYLQVWWTEEIEYMGYSILNVQELPKGKLLELANIVFEYWATKDYKRREAEKEFF